MQSKKFASTKIRLQKIEKQINFRLQDKQLVHENENKDFDYFSMCAQKIFFMF